jgi:hypothetical protein
MLIAVKNEVAKPLCLLFNKSFQCKIFPNNWKIAFITGRSIPSSSKSVIEQKYLFVVGFQDWCAHRARVFLNIPCQKQ